MSLVNAGRDLITKMIIGETHTPLNNANAYLGVGDSPTVFSAAHTDLQAGANKFRQGMEATYPQRTGAVMTFRSLFATGSANFAWNEWGSFNASTAGEMLQRKVESLGTKTSAQTWQLTVTLTTTLA